MEKEYTSGNNVPAGNLLGIDIESDARSKLQTVAVWSKITAIGGFVSLAMGLITSVTRLQVIANQRDPTWFFVTQVVMLVISLYLNFSLWQFSKHLKTSLDTENQESFTEAAAQLKAYLRMLGILLIVSIILRMIGSFVAAGFSRL